MYMCVRTNKVRIMRARRDLLLQRHRFTTVVILLDCVLFRDRKGKFVSAAVVRPKGVDFRTCFSPLLLG